MHLFVGSLVELLRSTMHKPWAQVRASIRAKPARTLEKILSQLDACVYTRSSHKYLGHVHAL